MNMKLNSSFRCAIDRGRSVAGGQLPAPKTRATLPWSSKASTWPAPVTAWPAIPPRAASRSQAGYRSPRQSEPFTPPTSLRTKRRDRQLQPAGFRQCRASWHRQRGLYALSGNAVSVIRQSQRRRYQGAVCLLHAGVSRSAWPIGRATYLGHCRCAGHCRSGERCSHRRSSPHGDRPA